MLKTAEAAGINVAPIRQYMRFLDAIMTQKAIDADAVYDAANVIDNLLLSLIDSRQGKASVEQIKQLQGFRTEIFNITSKLLDMSYTDRLHSNSNLSDQIKNRLPKIIVELTELVSLDDIPGIPQQNLFKRSLNRLANRFLNTNRFAGGIGMSFEYLPTLNVRSNSFMDFTPHQSQPDNGRVIFQKNTVFEDKS